MVVIWENPTIDPKDSFEKINTYLVNRHILGLIKTGFPYIFYNYAIQYASGAVLLKVK